MLKAKHEELTNKWEEHKESEKKKQEDNLLELCPNKIARDDENAIKRRKKLLKLLSETRIGNRHFALLLARVCEGNKKSLQRMQIENE